MNFTDTRLSINMMNLKHHDEHDEHEAPVKAPKAFILFDFFSYIFSLFMAWHLVVIEPCNSITSMDMFLAQQSTLFLHFHFLSEPSNDSTETKEDE